MGKYLALDYGAESGRLVSVEFGKKISTVEISRFATPVTKDKYGRRCWDFPQMLSDIKNALKAVPNKSDFKSIAVDTWGLDFAFIDENNKLIDLPVSYRDHRTDGMLAKAAEKVGLDRLHNETGSQLLEVNAIYQLFAIAQNNPKEFEAAKAIIYMPDLILLALTDVAGTEYTIATTSGIYDAINNKWAEKLADDLNIPKRLFQPVQMPGSLRGKLSKSWQNETGFFDLPCIATCSHDTASAVVATPFAQPGSGFISSGTWSLLGVELNRFFTNETTLKERLTNEGGYGKTNRLIRNVMGLWLIQEVRRDFESKGEKYSYAQLVELAQSVKDPWRTLIHVDASIFIHAENMIERIQRFARETNQPIPTTPGEIAATVFSSLALQYAKTFDVLEKCAQIPMQEIHIVGGGSQNQYLSQLTADVCNRTVITGPVEATAIGNAVVQAISAGEIKDMQSARKVVMESGLVTGKLIPQKRAEISAIRARYSEIAKIEMR